MRRAPAGWCVTADDRDRPLALHPTVDDALALAHALARHGARVVVHTEETVMPALRATGTK